MGGGYSSLPTYNSLHFTHINRNILNITIMAYQRLSINNFRFKLTGYGRYEVTYTSPKIGKQWKASITDMSLIDDTKNAEEPRQYDLRRLLYLVKHGVHQY